MTQRKKHSIIPVLAVLVAAILVAGCDNTVEPFSETTKHFAIFGFLDGDAEVQFLRIEPTRPRPEESGIEIGAIVTTTDLATGEIVVWRDSLVSLADDAEALIYTAQFRPRRGRTYRLEVSRPDGARSYVEVTIPPVPDTEIRNPRRTFTGTYEQTILFGGVDRRPEWITMNYDVTFGTVTDPVRITLDYNVFGSRSLDGWRINVRLSRDKERILDRLSLEASTVMYLHDVSMTTRLLTNDWPIPESIDRVTNVVDGYGFVGAAVTHAVAWRIDSTTVRMLGYIDRQGGE